jgi:hypothetical protein
MPDGANVGTKNMPYPIEPADGPCVVCGQPIQSGQLYKPGPRHLGCYSYGSIVRAAMALREADRPSIARHSAMNRAMRDVIQAVDDAGL